MPFAPINDQQIFFTDSGGTGPAVILSHGFMMDHEMFAPQVAALADTYRVITWDERGHGQTVVDNKPFSYWDSADDCVGLLTHLGIERAVVGGMSQGGFLSLRVALRYPEKVRALILLDTEAGCEHEPVIPVYRGMMAQWMAEGPLDSLTQTVAGLIIGEEPESSKWVAKWRAQPWNKMEFAIESLLTRDDLTARLAEITCPALVVHGESDIAIDAERANALAAGLSGCSGVTWVPGHHAANLTHPEAVNAAITAFLAAQSLGA